MLKYGSVHTGRYVFYRTNRSSRGLVHAYVRDLGHPWVQGPYLPYKAIYDVYVKYSKSALESGIKKWYHAIPHQKWVLEQCSSVFPLPVYV